MAQDLVESHPQAISTDEFGFYRVTYEMLGLEMITFNERKDNKEVSNLTNK